MIDMAGERQVGRNNRKNGIAKAQELQNRCRFPRAQDVYLDMDMKTICNCGRLRPASGVRDSGRRLIDVLTCFGEKVETRSGGFRPIPLINDPDVRRSPASLSLSPFPARFPELGCSIPTCAR